MERKVKVSGLFVILLAFLLFPGCQNTEIRLTATGMAKAYLNEYHTLDLIITEFKNINETPPTGGNEKMEVSTGFLKGFTLCGNQIPYISLTNSITATSAVKTELNENIPVSVAKSEMLFVSGHHSDECVPPEVIMAFFHQIEEQFKKSQTFRDELKYTVIHIIPIVNVDTKRFMENRANQILTLKGGDDEKKYGPFNYSSGIYRKNMNNGSKGCKTVPELTKGVDLNRNYEARWSNLAGIVDSVNRQNETVSSSKEGQKYPGIKPLSEAENVAIVNFMNAATRLVFVLDLHDKLGPEIERNQASTVNAKMEAIVQAMKFSDGKKNIAPLPGKILVSETQVQLPGTLQSQCIADNIPFVYTIEIGRMAFPQDLAYISQNCAVLPGTFFAMVAEIAAETKAGIL